MDDKTIQRKLNQLTKIVNELHHEARKRYGEEGLIFFEAEGQFHVMAHDRESESVSRQEGVRFSSDGCAIADCGGW